MNTLIKPTGRSIPNMPVLAPLILPTKLTSVLTPIGKGAWVNCACSEVFINVYTHLCLISFAQYFSNEIHLFVLIGIWIVARF